jgi:hypothetical protein
MALRWLFNKTGENARWAFLQGLLDSHWEIRRASVNFLGMIGSVDCAVGLCALLRDENTEVRATTAQILGNLGSEQTVGALIRALADVEISVREASLDALNGFMSVPINIDIQQSRSRAMSSFVEDLVKWWAESRPEGPPWQVPSSIIEKSKIALKDSFEIIQLFGDVDEGSTSRKNNNIKQGNMR